MIIYRSIFTFILFSTALLAGEIKIVNNAFQKGSNVQMQEFKPLETINFSGTGKYTLKVYDGSGKEYFQSNSNAAALQIGGALGVQTAMLMDDKGKLLDKWSFKVDTKTELRTSDTVYQHLLKMLVWNIFRGPEFKIVPYQGKPYVMFSDWIRDHTHILKGKKYYYPFIKDAVELYGNSQQPNGMLFDYLMPNDGGLTNERNRFIYNQWIWVPKNSDHYFQRVPIEADVEYLYTECLYNTWKATGETDWMKKYLPVAEKAMQYSLKDSLRWSDKYKLIKRGYTLDTWDYTHSDDAQCVNGDIMDIHKTRTHFGVMHGDNTGFAASCNYIAEMYRYIGDQQKAAYWEAKGKEILADLEKVSWNGNFYRHFVSEDKTFKRNTGYDENTQVSLSNTWALNRGIGHDKAVAIIKTYQKIRKEMPASSAGEFYSLYPPDEAGYYHKKWHYVNGGVFPFIAGELSHGAFENGFEEYGVDILRRVSKLLETHNEEFPYYWLGKIEEAPDRKFNLLPLKTLANTDFSGKKTSDAIAAWTGEGTDNDLASMPVGSLTFSEIPFEVIDPASNGRKASIGLGNAKPYAKSVTIPVKQKAASLYFLHTMAGGGIAGNVTFYYADGTSKIQYVNAGNEVANWWRPTDKVYNRVEGWTRKVATKFKNNKAEVGTYVWGLNNPSPDKVIDRIELNHSGLDSKWFVLGITLSDKPVYFKPQDNVVGWLYNWNTGSLIYSMFEGLVGIKDIGVAFDKVLLSPRWEAANEKEVSATVKYEASGGYMSYIYKKSVNNLNIAFTGNAAETNVELLMPKGKKPAAVKLNDVVMNYGSKKIEQSEYITFTVNRLGVNKIEVVF